MNHSPLPSDLGPAFSTARARALGVGHGRLRGRDLEAPFHGVRLRTTSPGPRAPNRFERARMRELDLIHCLAQRLVPGQFFSHRSAALLWGAPLPHLERAELHVSTHKPQRAPRISGARGHCLTPERARTVRLGGVPLVTPGLTFASMGALSLPSLVALGDYLARAYRPGHGRPNVGRRPLATPAQLGQAAALGRWSGSARLRAALALVREDSWSPQESLTRFTLVSGGLPEPELNVDLFDRHGRFLACVDMVYPEYRVIVEYQGELHGDRYAEDVERVEALSAEGWKVIQVTRALRGRPAVLVERVTSALRSRGWEG